MSSLKNYGKVTAEMMKTFNQIVDGNEEVFKEFMEELASCSEKEQAQLKKLFKQSVKVLEEKWRSDKSTGKSNDADAPVDSEIKEKKPDKETPSKTKTKSANKSEAEIKPTTKTKKKVKKEATAS